MSNEHVAAVVANFMLNFSTYPFGIWATSIQRPLVLRPRLATGLPLSMGLASITYAPECTQKYTRQQIFTRGGTGAGGRRSTDAQC